MTTRSMSRITPKQQAKKRGGRTFTQKRGKEGPYDLVEKEVHGQLVMVKVYRPLTEAEIMSGEYDPPRSPKWNLTFRKEDDPDHRTAESESPDSET